jgi:pimeloyl-ACP methyl ester carboxylesterase
VSRPLRTIAALLLGASAVAFSPIGSADAQIAFSACKDSNNFACGHLAVPLDPGGGMPGTLKLAIRRHRAPIAGPDTAIIALAGGPGQAALPLTESFLELLGPIAATRDLIVFDQRGTGMSHPLSCPAPKHPGHHRVSQAQAVVRCAEELGAGRAFYATQDSVADIEAIRQAGGYEKLVLYGTSYGTKVAEEYAQEHPGSVEALVLDSVVTPNGPDPLNRSTFAAVPRILDRLCSFDECAHITRDPVADLAHVVARTGHRGLLARVIDNRGRPHAARIHSDELMEILLEGDFNALLRAEFIPAVSAAARGDTAELARLLTRIESSPEVTSSGAVADALYLATTCEDEEFPWSRTAVARSRLSEAGAQLRSLPVSTFAPFTAANALSLSDIEPCAYWPYATPAARVETAPLPNVPALVLSGAGDLRTPTANAREVAARIPDSHLLVVPYAGHSVLTNEPTSCASDALQALFARGAIHQCKATPPPPARRLPPLPPLRLADVAPERGYNGASGRTLTAARLTLSDFARQLVLSLLEALGSEGLSLFKELAVSGGGLRAGWYQLKGSGILLHGYSYVPGVTLSGSVAKEHTELVVGGPAAAPGALRADGSQALSGVLGGVPVKLTMLASAAASARGAAGTPIAHWGRLLAPVRRLLELLPSDTVDLAELSYLLASRRMHEPWLTR